jgi:hypothetical protein
VKEVRKIEIKEKVERVCEKGKERERERTKERERERSGKIESLSGDKYGRKAKSF